MANKVDIVSTTDYTYVPLYHTREITMHNDKKKMTYSFYYGSVPHDIDYLGKPTEPKKTHYKITYDVYHYFRYLAFIRGISENQLANEIFAEYVNKQKEINNDTETP